MVKEGYKETEIGIIPEDWDVKSFREIFSILPNNTFSRAQLSYEVGTAKNIHYGDVLVRFGCILDCKLENLPYINENNNKHLKNRLQEGDLIFADTAEDETVGKAIEIINVGDSKIVSGLHTIPCRAKESIFAAKWLGYYANHDIFHDQLIPYITGIKVSSISKAALQKTLFIVPPMQEQKEIAQALYDMDKLILSLEKLIEKKKAIKQALLQKMFPANGATTPEIRLPGFTGAWEQRKLGEIAVYKNGKGHEEDQSKDGLYELVNLNSISIDGGLKPSGKFINDGSDTLIENDLVMVLSDVAHGDLLGRVAIIPENNRFVLNQRVALLRIQDKTNPYFLFSIINRHQDYFKKLGAGSSQLNISKSTVEEFIVDYPKVEEQKKIGVFFSNLDNLITLHQRKLEKCEKIKQGIMQKLLTGEIRLMTAASVSDKDSIKDRSESKVRKHNQQFDDAVVISGIVDRFYSEYPLGRKKVQKLLYFLRRHQEADTSVFKKKAAGPYADEIRYKGGEPIAVHNRYIVTTKNNKGTLFLKGEKIADALEYLRQWNQDGDLQWLVTQFKYTKTNKLELLATIDMAMCDLERENVQITIESIKTLIKLHKEWKNKLSKNYFSDKEIKWAIEECNRLFR